MHHIFVNENEIDINSKVITIDKIEDEYNFNHLVKSLRIEKDEQVLCSVMPFKFSFDYLAKVFDISNDYLKMKIIGETSSNELPIKVNLYQGIVKSDKFEYIVEKAVELGAYSITPVDMEYCVAKIDNKKKNVKVDRYNKIGKSAAEQSKRHIIPEVREPIKFTDMVNQITVDNKGKIIFNCLFYENEKGIEKTKKEFQEIAHKAKTNDNVELNIIIGTEGGFSKKEIELASKNGINILSLGDRILRTETASLTVLSIIMYLLS